MRRQFKAIHWVKALKARCAGAPGGSEGQASDLTAPPSVMRRRTAGADRSI
jgi:hypothetical protein